MTTRNTLHTVGIKELKARLSEFVERAREGEHFVVTDRGEKGDLDAGSFQDVQETLESDWPSFVLLPVRERRAGALAVKHLLRGFDAVHLAAAFDLRDALGGGALVFSSFDRKLLSAARDEGFPVLGVELENNG